MNACRKSPLTQHLFLYMNYVPDRLIGFILKTKMKSRTFIPLLYDSYAQVFLFRIVMYSRPIESHPFLFLVASENVESNRESFRCVLAELIEINFESFG